MNVVLVCLTNFQHYILDNINQLIKLGHKNIYVITESTFFTNFILYKDNITLIDANLLNDSFNFKNKTSLDNNFRNGFWMLSSLRLFVIYEFMKQYNIKNVIHLENDVLVYYNCEILLNYINPNKIYIPFDCYARNIASIIYIPDAEIFKTILNKYDVNKNDMENFAILKKETKLIEIFPIFPQKNASTPEEQFVSENSNIIPYIFDAAAMGQFLGGVDPRNISGNTVGFINETCIIKYNLYNFKWITIDNINKPFLTIHNETHPIFNLHIHSKNLQKFM